MNVKTSAWKIQDRIKHSLKVSPHKIIINYKEKNSNFAVEKPYRYHLKQVSKVNTTSNGPTISTSSSNSRYDALGQIQHSFSNIPAKSAELEFDNGNTRQTQIKGHCKIDLYFWKMSMSWNPKTDWGTVLNQREMTSECKVTTVCKAWCCTFCCCKKTLGNCQNPNIW